MSEDQPPRVVSSSAVPSAADFAPDVDGPGGDGPDVDGPDIDALAAGDDFDFDSYSEWCAREEAAGRERVPEPWELEGPAISISVGDASDIDPTLIAAMCGRDSLGNGSLSAAFDQHQAADGLHPGPVLDVITEQAVDDLDRFTDNQLMGALAAARRLQNRASYLQTVVIAEFARRRAVQREEARSRKVPKAWRPGEYPDEELAMELVASASNAAARICEATDLTTRLPRTLAGMADGSIDAYRASIIYGCTFSLDPVNAARADEILAEVAPGLRYDQLSAKARALEMKLDPEAVARRKALARKQGQRVEARREDSGNASIAGREMDTATALAIKANIDALAARLRSGNHEGTLQRLRYLAFTELLQGRNPLDRLARARAAQPPSQKPTEPTPTEPAPTEPAPTGPAPTGPTPTGPAPAGPAPAGSPEPKADDAPAPTDWEDDPGYRDYESDAEFENDQDFVVDPAFSDADKEESTGAFRFPSGPGTRAGGLAPMPALINLVVPVGTFLGWSTAPAQAGGWGLLDANETRDVVRSASRQPRTRWCFTIVGHDGTAVAHACAPGQHPWKPPEPEDRKPPDDDGASHDGASHDGASHDDAAHDDAAHDDAAHSHALTARAAELCDLFRRMKVNFGPIAKDTCDHTDAEDRYTPSRQLKHLVRARTTKCTAPGCNAQAIHCDLDHTLAYPDGQTCQCNLAPKCRRHHRVKQAPGWQVDQPQPGFMRWTLPNGRTHTSAPTTYDF